MNKEQIAQDYFKNNPEIKKAFVTDDGLIFKSQNMADLHATGSSTGKKLGVSEFVNKDLAEGEDTDTKVVKLTAEQRIELVQKCVTAEELAILKEKETAKTVLAAIDAKLAELSNPDTSNHTK